MGQLLFGLSNLGIFGAIPAVIAYNRFINTMKQEPVIEQLLPRLWG